MPVYVQLDSTLFWSSAILAGALMYHGCIISRAIRAQSSRDN